MNYKEVKAVAARIARMAEVLEAWEEPKSKAEWQAIKEEFFLGMFRPTKESLKANLKGRVHELKLEVFR